jgi:competence protein ComEA
MSMERKVILATVLALLTALPAFAEQLNINEASAEQLQTLDGVGEVRAQAILDYRESQGRFESVDELMAVDGIGDATLSDNRGRVTVGTVE